MIFDFCNCALTLQWELGDPALAMAMPLGLTWTRVNLNNQIPEI